jgi:hypothetical protein
MKRLDIISDVFSNERDHDNSLKQTKLLEEYEKERRENSTTAPNKHIADTMPLNKITHSLPFNLLLHKYITQEYKPQQQYECTEDEDVILINFLMIKFD